MTYRLGEYIDYLVKAGGITQRWFLADMMFCSDMVAADMSSIRQRVSCYTNVHSHEEFLRRSGVAAPDDKFFERVPTIAGRNIYWGSAAPEPPLVVGTAQRRRGK